MADLTENPGKSLDRAQTHAALPLISISIPVLDEVDNLAALYDRLCRLSETLAGSYELEFVFSDNHSSDGTWDRLSQLAASDPRVKAIRFHKNVGFQRSILANYLHTSGDAVMQIDADLQDPPEMLAEFLKLWREGYAVVYGIRRVRPEGVLLSLFRRIGYWVIDKMSEHPIPRDVGDFRLVDRDVINALVKMRSPNPYLRGMIAGLGFKQTGILYDRSARLHGQSKFNISRLVRLGLTAIFNHSVIPLRLASILGASILFFSLLGAVVFIVEKLIQPDYPRGLASIHVLVLFGIGLQAFLLGIIGEYLLRIYLILRSEPLAIVEQSLNLADDKIRL